MLAKRSLDGHVEGILLSLLRNNSSYGYRIVQELNQIAPDVLRMGEGTVYPVLHRMEERGLLKATWETHSGRDRKYYSLTAKGKRKLAADQQQWMDLQKLMGRVFEISNDSKQSVQGAML